MVSPANQNSSMLRLVFEISRRAILDKKHRRKLLGSETIRGQYSILDDISASQFIQKELYVKLLPIDKSSLYNFLRLFMHSKKKLTPNPMNNCIRYQNYPYNINYPLTRKKPLETVSSAAAVTESPCTPASHSDSIQKE